MTCRRLCLRPLAVPLAIILFAALFVSAQSSAEKDFFSNPIIPGFSPDPSICRVDDDFYLITSTFEYFPGIPIYHSRDLVNWELINYALSDSDQVDLENVKSSDGIHASTIRYHNGLFYIITTNNVDGKMTNFVVTAKDPREKWSKPIIIENAPGIDPSLFFDDDGRVWYTGNWIPPDPEFEGQAEIWLQELEPKTLQLKGERFYLWRGCCGGAWAEGPHIYKKDGYYYLMISEGGTLYEHAVSIAASKKIEGPYQNNLRNPILSHRQLSYDYPITGVGHADLVELKDGRWYMVALGWRYIDGRHGILGRETFLVPVKWEREPYWWKEEKMSFPVVSPVSGRIENRFPLPFEGKQQRARSGFRDEFGSGELNKEWNYRRSPGKNFIEGGESLKLYLQPGAVDDRVQYGFVGVRQRDFEFEAMTRMSFQPSGEKEEAGLMVIQNERAALIFTLQTNGKNNELVLRQIHEGSEQELFRIVVEGVEIYLKVFGSYLKYGFAYSPNGTDWTTLKHDADGTIFSPAVLKGYNYTGVYLGLYASSNGSASGNFAAFDWFEYNPTAIDRDGWFQRQERLLKAGVN